MVVTNRPAKKGLNARCQRFAALLAGGATQAAAYMAVWPGTKRSTAQTNGCVLAARPDIAAAVRELRELAWADEVMSLRERRALLGQTARSVPKRLKASHSDRIAAIREDSILAGDRQREGAAVSVSVDVRSIVGALGATIPPAHAHHQREPRPVEPDDGASACEPQGAAPEGRGGPQTAGEGDGASACGAGGSEAAGAVPASAVALPLPLPWLPLPDAQAHAHAVAAGVSYEVE